MERKQSLLEWFKTKVFTPTSKSQSTWIHIPDQDILKSIGTNNKQRKDYLDAAVYSISYLNNLERIKSMVKSIKVGVKVLYTLEIESENSIEHIIIESGNKCTFTVIKNAEERTITGSVIRLVENKYVHDESYFMVDVSTTIGSAYEFITLRNIINVTKV